MLIRACRCTSGWSDMCAKPGTSKGRRVSPKLGPATRKGMWQPVAEVSEEWAVGNVLTGGAYHPIHHHFKMNAGWEMEKV